MSQTHQASQIDEAGWQAWLDKNNAQDRFRYKRRLTAFALVAVFITVSVLLGTFAG